MNKNKPKIIKIIMVKNPNKPNSENILMASELASNELLV